MTEHFFHACPDLARDGDAALATFKGSLRTENAALGWIADVANAMKHVRPHSGRIGYGDVEVLATNECGVMRAGWPLGGEEVVVGAEREWLLRELVKEAMRSWRGRLGVPATGNAPT